MAKKQTDTESAKPKVTVITAADIGLQDAEMVSVNEQALSSAVRAFFQNTRQGTVGVKGRSDVAFSTRKPWKQKGTGRARVGSRRSPLWRKGGVTFGPQPRIRKLGVPRKVKKQVLTSVFHQYLASKKIASLEWQSGEVPKTRSAAHMLHETGLVVKKNVGRIVLFVDRNDVNTIHSFRNLPKVNLLPFDTPNVYELTCGDTWVFLAKDVEQFKMMVAQWI